MNTFLNREVPFSQVSNYALRDQNLSRKAKGLYAEIYSYITIPNFKLSKSYLMKMGLEGETAFNSMWKELKEKGYLKQYRISVNNNGVISFIYKYNLLDKPDVKTPYLTNIKLNGELGETYGGLSENIENSEQEKPFKTYPPSFVPGTPYTRYMTYQVHDMEGINNTDINNTDISVKKESKESQTQNKDISPKKETFDSIIDQYVSEMDDSKDLNSSDDYIIENKETLKEALRDLLKSYVQMRFRIRKPLTNKSLKCLLQKLRSISNNTIKDQISIIESSLIGGYSDIFPLKLRTKHERKLEQEINASYNIEEYESYSIFDGK